MRYPISARTYRVTTPLQKRLVALVVVVSSLAMILSFTFVYFLMQHILYQRADEQLEEGLETWVGQTVWLPGFGAPSEFYQGILVPGHETPWAPRPRPHRRIGPS
ncbi:hypothetical protein [Corynebacterium aquatimens]|uniref:hypothetical protein n=1 Tax=Corynebacterium aquatimens TaxID=1190508 RepID=UPI002540782F|nr:hypothetical protein [Corynebacterium aquatimens]